MPSGTAIGEALPEVVGPVVDRGVEAELLDEGPALVRATGDADGTRALELRDLADRGPDRTGGGGDHDGLPRLRLAEQQQPGVRREAGHPEHAERRLDRRLLRVERTRVPCRRRRPGSASRSTTAPSRRPAGPATATRRPGTPCSHHDATQWHRVGVRLGVAHPTAHVRVQREVAHLQQHLAVLERRQVDGDGLEVGRGRLTVRARLQLDLRGLGGRVVMRRLLSRRAWTDR